MPTAVVFFIPCFISAVDMSSIAFSHHLELIKVSSFSGIVETRFFKVLSNHKEKLNVQTDKYKTIFTKLFRWFRLSKGVLIGSHRQEKCVA